MLLARRRHGRAAGILLSGRRQAACARSSHSERGRKCKPLIGQAHANMSPDRRRIERGAAYWPGKRGCVLGGFGGKEWCHGRAGGAGDGVRSDGARDVSLCGTVCGKNATRPLLRAARAGGRWFAPDAIGACAEGGAASHRTPQGRVLGVVLGATVCQSSLCFGRRGLCFR